MQEIKLDGDYIKAKIKEYCDNSMNCGLEAYVVKKDAPKLKRILFWEEDKGYEKNFRLKLKDMFFEILREKYLDQECEYADGNLIADNQDKYYIIKQSGNFYPFAYLSESNSVDNFSDNDLKNSFGLIFCLRKGEECIWLYQHLWSIMVPNKKKTSPMARLLKFENQTYFSEQREDLLIIAKKIDIIILDEHLITNNITLLQKYFGFNDYIYQRARQTVESIVQKGIIKNTNKLEEYINRGKSKYAKKMMRIDSSIVFNLSKEQLMDRVNTLPRWKDKFIFDKDSHQIILNSYKAVESLIDLFDERYTRSDVTNIEYDTDVKTVAKSMQ